MRKILASLTPLLLSAALAAATTPALATSIYIPSWERESPLEVTNTGIPAGTRIYLFYGGDLSAVQGDVAAQSILPVYRGNPAGCPGPTRATGNVRLLSTGVGHFAEAEIHDGSVREGDFVQGRTVVYLVTSSTRRCSEEQR